MNRYAFPGLLAVIFVTSYAAQLLAQGGCGSMCLPLDAISPLPRFYSGLGPDFAYDSDPTSSDSEISPDSDLTFEAITGLTMRGKFIASVTTEFANFDNFREGDSDVTNPGGNKAFIQQTTLFLDYGLTDKFVASFMLPYVSKLQDTTQLLPAEAGRLRVFRKRRTKVLRSRFGYLKIIATIVRICPIMVSNVFHDYLVRYIAARSYKRRAPRWRPQKRRT